MKRFSNVPFAKSKCTDSRVTFIKIKNYYKSTSFCSFVVDSRRSNVSDYLRNRDKGTGKLKLDIRKFENRSSFLLIKILIHLRNLRYKFLSVNYFYRSHRVLKVFEHGFT